MAVWIQNERDFEATDEGFEGVSCMKRGIQKEEEEEGQKETEAKLQSRPQSRSAESAGSAKPKRPEQTSTSRWMDGTSPFTPLQSVLFTTNLAAMMSQSLRASRSLFSRVSRQQVSVARRSFLTSAVRQADPVQDLYLRELKAYKPTPVKPGDAEAHVQKFAVPKPPQSPEETNLANELQSYESQDVEVEGQAASGEAAPAEEHWFVEEEEEEAPASH